MLLLIGSNIRCIDYFFAHYMDITRINTVHKTIFAPLFEPWYIIMNAINQVHGLAPGFFGQSLTWQRF